MMFPLLHDIRNLGDRGITNPALLSRRLLRDGIDLRRFWKRRRFDFRFDFFSVTLLGFSCWTGILYGARCCRGVFEMENKRFTVELFVKKIKTAVLS